MKPSTNGPYGAPAVARDPDPTMPAAPASATSPATPRPRGTIAAMVADDELVTRWQAGDQAAGEALFTRYFDSLYRFFATKSSEPGDLTQRTLLAVVRARDQFAGRSSFRTYLFSIARNELYDQLRAQQRERRFDPEVSSIVDLATTPATRLDRGDRHRVLGQALRELPVEQQTLLELHYWEGLDAAALGEVFGSPPTTIRTRLRRARLALRDRLAVGGAGEVAALESDEALDAWAKERQREHDHQG